MIGALLGAGADRRGAALLEQVATSKVVSRERPAPERFTLAIEYVTTEPVTAIARAVVTPWVTVPEAATGEPLELRVRVHRGGIFDRLEGRAPDGRWPAAWSVAENALRDLPPADLPVTPSASACVATLRSWLGLGEDVPSAGRPQCFAPAAVDAVAEVERREGAPLPAAYRALVAATDGLELGRRAGDVHGIDDVYLTELEGASWWVVGEQAGEPLVVRAGDGADATLMHWPHDAPTRASARAIAPDLAAHVRAIAFPGDG